MSVVEPQDSLESIAIIGINGRFPGADSVEQFWRNLCAGVEAITCFSEHDLRDAGVPREVLEHPNYVRARGMLDSIELFDAAFFGFTPREAAVMDPQQRLFLECAWEVLERAGYNTERYDGRIGVYAGMSLSSYLLANLYPNAKIQELVGELQLSLGNDKDHLSTWTGYKLNLTGPCVSIQTACSTSLVAVGLACQSLLTYQCDMALAGGASIRVPQRSGYLYQEGGILSPDGHCRTFDAQAQGTVSGDGVGIVALKRLEDALADGDQVLAVIKGFGLNNDGAHKVGYTAPSVTGQAEVIATAQAMAGVSADTIGYVEAHGTATPLGDPIEITALTQAFQASTHKNGYCAIGSVKTNIGHLDAAAGVAGLIKTVLALQHHAIPPSLHFERPNPQINFASTPFYVNAALGDWPAGPAPRRAGVSSFGIGGTNAHLVLEEAPALAESERGRPQQLLTLSARTAAALDAMTARLAAHLRQHPQLNLADVAYTLQVGRRVFNHRRTLVCHDLADAVAALELCDGERVMTRFREVGARQVAWLFPGQGAQHVRMGFDLYQSEPVFRQAVDRCAALLKPQLGLDLREVLYPSETANEDRGVGIGNDTSTPNSQLDQTELAQPALFVISYAMAQLWMSWGVRPQAMIGHSIGEYVAACLSGVLTLEDALALVAIRGRLMQQLAPGAMLVVPLAEQQVTPLLGTRLALAAINGPALCIVSGPHDAVEELQSSLSEQGLVCRRLHTSHAFHSAAMDPILESFTEQVRRVRLQPPQIPYLSNVTGAWITAAEAQDPGYWARHLRQTVRFAEGLRELLQESSYALLEVGPGHTLSTFARLQSANPHEHTIVSSMRHPHDPCADTTYLLNALGQLWLAGLPIDWLALYGDERRRRVLLPTYPFERQRHWVEPQPQVSPQPAPGTAEERLPDMADWFSVPVWKRAPLPTSAAPAAGSWLVFLDRCGVGDRLVRRLAQAEQDVVVVQLGEQFARIADKRYVLAPADPSGYMALLKELQSLGHPPTNIVHLWSVTDDSALDAQLDRCDEHLNAGFYSLLLLMQALGERGSTLPIQLALVSNHIYDVTGEEPIVPAKAAILGPCRVIPQEYPFVTTRSIDILVPEPDSWQADQLTEQLFHELIAQAPETLVAYRRQHRWNHTFEPVHLDEPATDMPRLRTGGTYVITGGLNGIGLSLAEFLGGAAQAKLVLVDRTDLPERDGWKELAQADAERFNAGDTIRRLHAITASGAEVLIFNADVTNRERMRRLLDEATARFGKIRGVVHAASAASGGLMQLKTAASAAQVIDPKVRGTLVLESLVAPSSLDFFVLCSSLIAITGGIGQVDGCAANAFLDAFAHAGQKRYGQTCLSVGWGLAQWDDLGALETAPVEVREHFMRIRAIYDITASEGWAALRRVLAQPFPQVVVSTQAIHAVLAQSASFNIANFTPGSEQIDRSLPHASYSPPRNELEHGIVAVWQDLFGIQPIGIHDNFFTLGGHSLLAIQLVSKLRDLYEVALPMTSLFNTPTVAGLAQIIAESQLEQLPDEEMDQLLREIEDLSWEDIQKQITQELEEIDHG